MMTMTAIVALSSGVESFQRSFLITHYYYVRLLRGCLNPQVWLANPFINEELPSSPGEVQTQQLQCPGWDIGRMKIQKQERYTSSSSIQTLYFQPAKVLCYPSFLLLLTSLAAHPTGAIANLLWAISATTPLQPSNKAKEASPAVSSSILRNNTNNSNSGCSMNNKSNRGKSAGPIDHLWIEAWCDSAHAWLHKVWRTIPLSPHSPSPSSPVDPPGCP